MLGLYNYTHIIGHKYCNMLIKLNKCFAKEIASLDR